MKIGRNHIKVIVDHNNHVHPDTVKSILNHIRHERVFALYTDDELAHVVFFPATLSAAYSTGASIIYKDIETFVDIIKLVLFEYPNFYTFSKKIPNAPVRKELDKPER